MSDNELVMAINNKQREYNELVAKVTTETTNLSKLQKEQASVRQSIRDLKKEQTRLEAQKTGSNGQVTKASQDLDKLNKEIASANSELSRAKSEAKKYQQLMESARNKKKTLESENITLQKTKQKLQSEIKELTVMHEELEDKMQYCENVLSKYNENTINALSSVVNTFQIQDDGLLLCPTQTCHWSNGVMSLYTPHVRIYTDASFSAQDKKAGYCAKIVGDGIQDRIVKGYYVSSDNNTAYAEAYGIFKAVLSIKRKSHIVIFTDCQANIHHCSKKECDDEKYDYEKFCVFANSDDEGPFPSYAELCQFIRVLLAGHASSKIEHVKRNTLSHQYQCDVMAGKARKNKEKENKEKENKIQRPTTEIAAKTPPPSPFC